MLSCVPSPAVRIELLRMLKEAGIAVHDPWAHDHVRSHRKRVAAKFHLFHRAAGQAPGWRIQAHRLLYHSVGVGETRQVFQLRRAAAENLAQLLTEFPFDFWMLAQQVPGPGQGNRSGLVPGQQESQDFVMQLAVGHAAAIFVASRHEHGKQVAGVHSAGAGAAE